MGQIVNFFYTLQGEAAGAQAFSNFDTLLAPFIAYDELSYGQVKQALQSFVFNLNVPTRVGFSTPFTNLSFDLKPPATLVLPVLPWRPPFWGRSTRSRDFSSLRTSFLLLRGRPEHSWRRSVVCS